MTRDDLILRAYLQTAYDRGGSYHMAMLMLISRIELLEDRLERANVEFEEDMILRKYLDRGGV